MRSLAGAGLLALLAIGAMIDVCAAQSVSANVPAVPALQRQPASQQLAAPAASPSLDRIRGLVVARQQATISAAQPATIVAIGPDNGERFEKGHELIRFDCGIYDAELKRARAIAEAARDTLKVKQDLAASGSVAKLQAMLAESELKKARAEVIVAEARVSYCVIAAPFAGRVVRRVANAYETVAPRDPLIEIVDDSSVEVRAFVPSHRIALLETGGTLRLTVDETGGQIVARIISVGAAIDNVSQLIEVRAAPVDGTKGLLAGMSGRVELDNPRERP